MGCFNQLLIQKMVVFAQSFWVSVSAFFLPLLGFIFRLFFRFQEDDSFGNRKPNSLEEPETETEAFKVKDSLVEEDSESPKSFLSFKFQPYQEFTKTLEENHDSVTSQTINTDKYEFIHGKDFGSFMEEPDAVSFTVKELYADSNNGSSSKTDISQKTEAILEDDSENSTNAKELDKPQEKEQLQDVVSQDDFLELSGLNEMDDSNYNNEFLSEKDFEELDNLMDIAGERVELSELEDFHHEQEDRDIGYELEKLEESQLHNSEMLSEDDFHGEKSIFEGGENMKDSSDKPLESEDSNSLETQWEHQELIEQLRMELRKVRATGLPTILEESESPKMMEDLKPWKIDDKFHHEERMDELHKIYKLYSERMRKFDILNYQKMYAMGFLQLKDPLQSISGQKSSGPAFTSLLSQNFRRKKTAADPMVSFIKELHSDLEMVYVGQLCLSWEFLHWQYERALELWESDPRGIRRYNEVAGEFQQFQVLMQRFIENEPFEGPRVQNYVKNRCILRNLLQVPVMREDSFKDRKRAIRKRLDDNAITSDMLVEIMEESIRIFWRFVRADKVESKGWKGSQVELQNPEESQLLMEMRTSLQKKEKKLKEILRSGNCILKKFQKNREDDSDQVLYFFSQVDMKLVSRVLNMSRLTSEQLVWCRNKLNKISFVSRRIHVDPSFLLFPC